jgi:hypothetical protein
MGSKNKFLILFTLSFCFTFVNQNLCYASECKSVFTDEEYSSLDVSFKNLYDDTSIYEPGRCYENTYRLLKKTNPSLFQQIRLIAIFPVEKTRMLQFNQRKEELLNNQGISSNRYHVILLFKGKIYDLSNKNNLAQSADDYFINMFGLNIANSDPSEFRKYDWSNRIVLREIPLMVFLSEENSLFSFRHIMNKQYPLKPLHELLR